LKRNLQIVTILSILLLFSKFSISQNCLNHKVDEEFSGSPFINFLQVTEAKDSIHFYYKEVWINSITIESPTKGQSLKSVIDQAIVNYGLSYVIMQGNCVVFIPEGYALDKNRLEEGMIGYVKVIGNLMDKGKFKENKVEGYVRYGKTDEPIAGAVIQDKKHKLSTASGSNGYFAINLPIGQTELEISFIGLETNVVKIDVLSPGKLDVDLMDASISLDMVTITSDGGKSKVNRTQIGVEAIDMKSLKKLPVLMGEADIIKSMTLLPGVQTAGEMSSGFNVRGGNVDQNLVLLNEAPIFNTSHLFGMFSTFIPGAISGAELYKGTQTANYGGRVSSVMDINLKKADTTKIRGNAGIGVLNSQFFIEGPIIKNFCSFLVGGRTTYSNWILKKIHDAKISNSKTNFYDAIGKLDFKFTTKHRMEIFAYQSNDFFDYGGINEFDYTSKLAALNYNWLNNSKSQFKANFSYSGFNSKLANKESSVQASRLTTGIEQLKGKIEYNLHVFNQQASIGVEANHFYIRPGLYEKYNDQSTIIPAKLENEKAIELAGYISDNYMITDNISLLMGLRYSWYSKYGACQEYIYQDSAPLNENTVIDSISYGKGKFVKPYQGIEPRLGLRIKLNSNSSLKLGYSFSRQYQQLITNSSSTTPSDYWKSADSHIKPMLCQQYSIGYFTTLMDDFFDLSAEIYYKETKNQLDYKEGAVLTMNNAIERDLIAGFAKSYGLETMIRKNIGDLTGWLSYTLSCSLMKADGAFKEEKINNGNYYAASNHRLHDISLTLSYQVTRRWNIATNFLFTSGRPITLPEKKYNIEGMEIVYFSERNKYRLPAYHRLDLAVTYDGYLNKKRRIHPSVTFAVYNVYAHKNVYSVYYKKDIPSSFNNYHTFGLYKLSIIGIPIPSITLNLNF
jgi:outer membrane receptor for ferrienterochelin and colicin